MKIVYIAGAYGDTGGYLAIDRNIAKAREAAAWLVEHGIGFFCPHLNTAHFEVFATQPVSFWYELDIRLMAACDAILMLDGWQNSVGSRAELAVAIERNMPIFYDIDGEGGAGEIQNLLEWAKPP